MEHHAVHEVDIGDAPPGRSRRPEWLAKQLLARWENATVVSTDVPGASSGTYDFELHYDDGRTAAVEVRTSIDRAAADFAAALESRGIIDPVEGIKTLWHVRLDESTRLDGLHHQLVPYLADLEKAGIEVVQCNHKQKDLGLKSPDYFIKPGVPLSRTSTPPQTVVYLEQLGVQSAWSYTLEQNPRGVVIFDRPISGGSGGTEHLVTEAVEAAAREKERVLSSERALAHDARHLFVWLDSDFSTSAEFALFAGYPGDAPVPTLPAPITTAWVACWSLDHGIGHVLAWRAHQGEGWTRVDLPGR